MKIKVFEPPMCCSSGMCGPTVDEEVAAFNDLLERLKKENHVVERYNVTSNIDAFLNDEQLMAIVTAGKLDELPITMVDGNIIKKGAYPTFDEIEGAG